MQHFWQRLNPPFFVLAPMAEVTDIVFRNFVLRYSRPEVVYTEFVATKALLARKRQVSLRRALWFSEVERPIVAQVFGADPAEMFASAQLIRRLGFDGMDINMGCPDRRVERHGAGAALIRDPPRAQALIQAAKAGLDGLPLSVKTRLGYHAIETTAWISALLVAQPDVLVVHGRTRQELSAVPAHWDEIALATRLAHDAEVLCVGNGDIRSREQGEDYAQRFGVDGVMIGRGVFGNPWVFAPHADRREAEKLQALADLITQFSGFWQTTKNDQILKKHFKAYVTGFPGSSALCARLLASQSAAEALDTLAAYFHHQGWPFPEPVYRRLKH
ncbi:MAG: tRNA-dihydrouridine synthase family protein [Candidatus Competibacteraceae bacterium]|nr:tRNA-dihydrouridine synthase family protein [Candidatus Competibacteraceae bacterium]